MKILNAIQVIVAGYFLEKNQSIILSSKNVLKGLAVQFRRLSEETASDFQVQNPGKTAVFFAKIEHCEKSWKQYPIQRQTADSKSA